MAWLTESNILAMFSEKDFDIKKSRSEQKPYYIDTTISLKSSYINGNDPDAQSLILSSNRTERFMRRWNH